MNILLVGSGGREHALAWKITQSKHCTRLFIAPGNAGTALHGENVNISVSDFPEMARFCLLKSIGLIVVGPEEPLVKGIFNYFAAMPDIAHIMVIGPSSEAAQLEGSKAFAKSFMNKYQIPTASYQQFDADSYEAGVSYIRNHALPIVLKADGLAAGKGVIICKNHIEALAEFELIIQKAKFGEAGRRVVVESFLDGIELSVFVLTDGNEYLLLPSAKDYKKIGKKDTGPNTGGMGAVSPVPFADEVFMQKVEERIIQPTIAGLRAEQFQYKGFVFIGLISVGGEPFVIEYNCRLGDPETEVIIPRINTDLVELFLATSQQRLYEIQLDINPASTVAIVAVSDGYPNEYTTGKPIDGLEEPTVNGTLVFHAGTRLENNAVLTNGGRVLVVTSYGENIPEAAELSNYMMEQLYFEGMYYRDDIGYEFK